MNASQIENYSSWQPRDVGPTSDADYLVQAVQSLPQHHANRRVLMLALMFGGCVLVLVLHVSPSLQAPLVPQPMQAKPPAIIMVKPRWELAMHANELRLISDTQPLAATGMSPSGTTSMGTPKGALMAHQYWQGQRQRAFAGVLRKHFDFLALRFLTLAQPILAQF